MQGRNNRPEALHFYRSSADAELRAAMTRAYERGVSREQVREVLNSDENDTTDIVSRLDQLKPLPASVFVEEERSSGPSLEEKRAAWRRLNKLFR